jgi:hypothetical protein
MLEPEVRQLIVDALRPPPGFVLDNAFGTTFTLDLVALLTAPVAFSLFDRQEADGTARQDPIALLQALRSHADRISIFCQAGQIAVPRDYRSLFVYLEDSIYPVIPPKPDALFHPKVWYLKFVTRAGDDTRYRLLCLSRNLTFDRSWDTILQLDGSRGEDEQHPQLQQFGHALVEMARRTAPLPIERAARILDLASEFARAQWELPEGFETVRFWPLGHDDQMRDPFEGNRGRMLVVSPFVTSGQLARLTKPNRNADSVLVTRDETFERLGGQATTHLAERLVLGSGVNDPTLDHVAIAAFEQIGESVNSTLHGLHAKCFVADAGRKARLWTGSANCTDAAFHGNVEFLVELTGSKQRCGVQAVLGEDDNRLGLRKLLEPYTPDRMEPKPPTEEELAELAIDIARRTIGSMPMTAISARHDEKLWQLQLQAKAPNVPITPEMQEVSVHIRPVTMGASTAQQVAISDPGFQLDFLVSEQSITPHFAVELTLGAFVVEFLAIATLVGAPLDRMDRVLSDVLKNRADVLRFLLLLLGDVEEALTAFDHASPNGTGTWMTGPGTEALLEPLVIAFARDPQRLRDVARFVEELRRGESASALLPEQWDEIWSPIGAALEKEPLA